MTTIKAAVKRHAVLAYFVLAFAISWGAQLLIVGGPGAYPAREGKIEELMPLLYPALIAGPFLSCLLLTGWLDGRRGLGDLGARLFRWRVEARWYMVALLAAPLLMLTALLALTLISPDYLPRIFTEDDQGFLLQFSVVTALMVAVFEELGWTGFATERLRARHGLFATALIVGLVAGLWRFPVIAWVGGSSGRLPMAVFLPASLFTWQPAYRVLMVWVYDHRRSVLVAILMQAALTAFWTLTTPLTIVGVRLIAYYVVLAAAFLLFTVAVSRRRRRRQPYQARPA